MAAPDRTVQERIASLKARATQKKQREADELIRLNRKGQLEQQLRDELTAALAPLAKLPLLPNGVVTVDWTCEGQTYAVAVGRKGWREADGEAQDDREVLVSFFVLSDHDGTEAWLTHDGDVIGPDVALDLATAAVEARFDA